jgi:hypothetical protein
MGGRKVSGAGGKGVQPQGRGRCSSRRRGVRSRSSISDARDGDGGKEGFRRGGKGVQPQGRGRRSTAGNVGGEAFRRKEILTMGLSRGRSGGRSCS